MTYEGCQTWFDTLLAWVLGASVALFAVFSGHSLVFPPELWDEVAVASHLRPPEHAFPLLWQACLSFFIDAYGIDACVKALRLLGPASLGVLAAVAYRLFSGYLPLVMKGEMTYTRWGRRIVRTTVATGAAMLVFSEPVWLAGRVLSPEMSTFLLTALALLSALFAVEKSSGWCLILMAAVSGVLAAETPLAILVPVAARVRLGFDCAPVPYAGMPFLANPLVLAVSTRRAVCTFLLCWTGAVAFNIAFYVNHGGGGETDANMFMAIVRYLLHYFRTSAGAMTPPGWLMVALVVLAPLVVTTFKKNDLTGVRKLLPVPYACLLLVAGLLAFLQSAGFEEFHFWKWEYGIVKDRYWLCLCMLGTSVTAMNALAVFAVDVFYRNHPRLFREMFPYETEDEPFVPKLLRTVKTSARLLRIPAMLVPLAVLGCILPFRFDSAAKEMSAIVNAIASLTADECGDASLLFSDGSYDAAVEVASARKGGRLKALSMMPGAGKYQTALRLRGETKGENRDILKVGVADALRTWVHGKYDCSTNIAVQVGTELWQRNGLRMPQAGGLVARTAGFAAGEAKRGIESAYRLARRIEDLYAKDDPPRKGYPELVRMFLCGQWRLARMARLRANAADAAKDWKLSEKESSLADRLDRLNPEWRNIQEKMTWIGMAGNMHLTPREGLKLGLARADFRMASAYAKLVAETDPDDMNANFALGMCYFTQKLYEKAEAHLKRCLVRAPREPAVLNNLAVVGLRLGKLDEAETNAVKALEIFPGSHEIKATLRHIKEARKELSK